MIKKLAYLYGKSIKEHKITSLNKDNLEKNISKLGLLFYFDLLFTFLELGTLPLYVIWLNKHYYRIWWQKRKPFIITSSILSNINILFSTLIHSSINAINGLNLLFKKVTCTYNTSAKRNRNSKETQGLIIKISCLIEIFQCNITSWSDIPFWKRDRRSVITNFL